MGSLRLIKVAFAVAILSAMLIVPAAVSTKAASINISPTTPPTISVSVISDLIYSDGLTFEVTINRNGATISDWNLEYSLDNQVTWPKKKGVATYDNGTLVKYNVPVSGLKPDQTVYYRAYLTYSLGTKTVTTDVFSTQTDPLPEVTLTVVEYDSEYVWIKCNFYPNGNKLLNRYTDYRTNGGDWHTTGTGYDDSDLKLYKLAPGTIVQMRGRVIYEKSGGATGEIVTEIYTITTNELPTVTLTVLKVDYESVTVQADCDDNRNTIDCYHIIYKFNDNLFFIPLDESNRIGTNRYKVVISGFQPEDFLQVSSQIEYQAISFRESSDRSIQGTILPVWINKAPEIQISIANIDFDSIKYDIRITGNSNIIAGSNLEYRFTSNQAWIQQNKTGSASWSSTISNITTRFINYRGALSCQTAVALRQIDWPESMAQLYSLSTDNWFYWYFDKAANRGNLEIFGYIYAPKISPTDVSYLDKGFIWSESANPVIGGSVNQVSLGNADLPDQSVKLTTTIANLPVGKSIYYRAYAIAEKGNIIYGDTKRFDTFAALTDIYTPTPSPGQGQTTPSPKPTQAPTASPTFTPTPTSTFTPTPAVTSSDATESVAESNSTESISEAMSPTPVNIQTNASDTSSASEHSTESTTSDDQTDQDNPGPSQPIIWIIAAALASLAAIGVGVAVIIKKRHRA